MALFSECRVTNVQMESINLIRRQWDIQNKGENTKFIQDIKNTKGIFFGIYEKKNWHCVLLVLCRRMWVSVFDIYIRHEWEEKILEKMLKK